MIRANPGWARTALFRRDKGICAICGCDASKELRRHQDAHKEAARLAERLYHNSRHDMDWIDGRWMPRPFPYTPKQVGQMRRALLERIAPPNHGWTLNRSTGWDADHIHPVEHGGGSCGLDNLQTLCHPCHKRKTSQQAAQKAQKRQPAHKRTDDAQPDLFAQHEQA